MVFLHEALAVRWAEQDRSELSQLAATRHNVTFRGDGHSNPLYLAAAGFRVIFPEKKCAVILPFSMTKASIAPS